MLSAPIVVPIESAPVIVPTELPIKWVGLDTLCGAVVSNVREKGTGIVATEHLKALHVVAAYNISMSDGVTYHRSGAVDKQTGVLSDWYGFTCGNYEVVPARMNDETTGHTTFEAIPLFACNEPSKDKTINCKIFMFVDDSSNADSPPVSISLITFTGINQGEELTIFYGSDRHDSSYPRCEMEWDAADANGLQIIDCIGGVSVSA